MTMNKCWTCDNSKTVGDHNDPEIDCKLGRDIFSSDSCDEGKIPVTFDILRYMKAGRGKVTISNEETGNRYTFKFSKGQARTNSEMIFVKLLTGANNESDYTYVGVLTDNGIKLTSASKVTAEAPSYKAFNWVIRHLSALDKYPQVKVYHEGVCGKCGRALTTPESIKSGIGPECGKRMS